MLLAEANQWPEDAAAYFGNGDECHMNFHFPLMPRMFMAIDMEDRFPIVDILAQTPTPPGTSQWALFLRNHDELTLEMVTDDERDYMYRAYATEPSARINLGIRRRLAPLMGNDRRKIELLNGLLLALPGTPVLYYGDEIGMGDNVFLGDRDGVRTPMQWNMDRNAGFSSANPQKLVLPVNIDSAFHYATLNVETQENNPSSLLWWTKRMVAARREFLAFGRGTIEILHPSNPKVLAFVRLFEDEVILVVANLSRSVQCVELALGAYEGLRPIELFGRTEFPAIQATPYFLTLSGHAFYWLSLKRGAARSDKERLSAYGPPIVDRRSFIGQGRSGDRALVDDALPGFLESRPWFPKHGRSIAQAATVDVVPLQEGLTLLLARIDYESRESELYPIFLRFVPAHEPGEEHGAPVSPLVRLRDGGSGAIAGCLVDALDDAATARTLLAAVAGRLDTPPSSDSVGVLKGTTVGEIDLTALGDPQPVPGKRANVIVQFDERYVLKTLRRTDEETPPELEVARHLSQRGFAHAPPVLGSLEYLRRGKRPVTLAIVERHVDNAETAWQKALSELARYYERVLTTHRDAAAPPAASVSPATLSATSLPPIVRELMGSFHESLTLLGRRTAELHRELSQGDEAAFTPEPYSAHDRRSDYQSLRNLAGEVLRRLQSLPPETPAGAQADAELALEHWGTVLKRFAPLLTDRSALVRIRCQGALDLEQIVFTGKDYVFLDQSRGWDISLHERRRKRLALRDLASLVRSMDLASVVALSESSTLREADRPAVAGWSRFWSAEATFALVAGYREAAAGSRLVPGSADALATLLDVFVLESTLRETLADLDEPTPDVGYPLHALRRVLEIA
jgi:maltose alpha-D-glucosyltransferase/alpha-amylase